MSSSSSREDSNIKIREIFAILTHGVDIIHYDKKNKSRQMKRLVWMDSDLLRICVDEKRPTVVDRVEGKQIPGLYMKDISEIRGGTDAFDFKVNNKPPKNPDCCLFLIGTEATICLELPGKPERDWFLERFQLIANDILTSNERKAKETLTWDRTGYDSRRLSEENLLAGKRLEEILTQGIQVYGHFTVKPKLCILSYEATTCSIVLQPVERSVLGYFVHKAKSILVDDIATVRLGTHSMAYVRTGCIDKHKECVSIIGTECVMDIQLATEHSRNLLSDMFRTFAILKQEENRQLRAKKVLPIENRKE